MSAHPATFEDKQLLAECTMSTGRTGGPGGQHRNKVETHVLLTHKPTGVSAQAGERRVQSDNKRIALFRLRLALAQAVRVERSEPSELWRGRVRGGQIRCNPNHADFPALLAEALDHLALADFEPKPAASALSVSTSQLIKFVKRHPPSFTAWNEVRKSNERAALR